MTKNRRLAASILAVLLLAVLMASLFAVTHEADHNCIGEDCPVCALIALCRGALKAWGAALFAVAALFAGSLFAAGHSARSVVLSDRRTPVFLKVKLLN